jgi:shikimate kinase
MSTPGSRPAGPRVVLVGPPGAGKSAVGRGLAERWDVPFRDTDDDVAAALGMSIPDVFVTLGEPAFRDAEAAAVRAALAEYRGVLALGGGAVLDADTRATLRLHAVVFLDVSLAAAVSRVGLARDRPLLLGSPRSRLKALMDARRPLYLEVARHVVDTSDTDIAGVVAAVADTVSTPREGS